MSDSSSSEAALRDLPDDREPPNPKSGLAGLIAIIAAIVLAILIGVFYGRSMWLAGGGPAAEIEDLKKAQTQKEQVAEQIEASDPQEAARLRSHVPEIGKRIDELQQLVEQTAAPDYLNSNGYYTARFMWTFTKFVGEDFFVRVLKLLVIPLVITSMIVGITSLGDIRKIGRTGFWTLLYYFGTACAAVLMGIVLVQVIQPGKDTDDTFAYAKENVMEKEGTTAVDTLLNVFRGRPGDKGSGMFPSNIFLAASTTNVLALITFAIIFGGVLTTIGREADVVIQFFRGANEAVMKMVHLVMWFAPLGIFGLVAHKIAEEGGGAAFERVLQSLAWYVGTVTLGLAMHALLLTALLTLLARRNPLKYIFGLARALLTAVTTASSSATLPVTLECVEENNGVSNRAASFVLPLGATINMDGTALYEAVAVIFIAQSLGIELTMAQLVIIFVTATLAAIGAAGIPEAGLVTMVIVLTAVGLPITGIGMILAIDWFLDRLRTTVNVYGDAVGAGIIDARVVKGN